MLKMYQSQSVHTGDSPDFWEENWASGEFETAVRFMAVDPIRPLFEEYLRPGSRMLEGGCGMGNYIAYYASRGFDVTGLDFAQRALRTLHIRQPDLKLVGGDVSQMPFPDETFDLYYSGGVVEHFEGGADKSLREARRVLKDDGILLISVPYYSPLRRLLTPFRKGDWRKLERSEADSSGIMGKRFFQYAYGKDEFMKMLSSAGLETIKTQGYAVLWGIQELPFFNLNGKTEFCDAKRNASSNEPVMVDIGEMVVDRQSSIIKRLVVSEDDSVPIFGLGVRVMRWLAANMMMYTCRRK